MSKRTLMVPMRDICWIESTCPRDVTSETISSALLANYGVVSDGTPKPLTEIREIKHKVYPERYHLSEEDE